MYANFADFVQINAFIIIKMFALPNNVVKMKRVIRVNLLYLHKFTLNAKLCILVVGA